MRVIGQIHGESRARVFSDYLFVQGLANEVEGEADDHWSVWVHDEHELDKAGQLLKEFQSNPDDPKFVASVQTAEEIKKKSREEHKAWERKLRSRRHLFRPLTAYGFGPLTFALIALSCVVFFWSDFGVGSEEGYERIRFLFISEVMVPGGWLDRLAGLPEIRAGEIWRLFTPMLIHFGALHIIFNMLWLRDLGSMIEARQSSLQLALLVFAMAAASNFAQYLMSGPGFGGMSGVVYGLLGYIWIRGKFDPGSGLFLHPSTVTMMLLWFFLCLGSNLIPIGLVPRIANTAHGAGLLMGMAWGYLSSLKYR